MWWRGSRWRLSRHFLLELVLSREMAGLSEGLRVGGRDLCVPVVHVSMYASCLEQTADAHG